MPKIKATKLSGEYYSSEQVATLLNLTRGRVRQMTWVEELEAVHVTPRLVLYPAKAIDRLAAQRKQK